jgi:hypothetical protein
MLPKDMPCYYNLFPAEHGLGNYTGEGVGRREYQIINNILKIYTESSKSSSPVQECYSCFTLGFVHGLVVF